MTAPFYYKSFFVYLDVVKRLIAVNNKIRFLLFGVYDARFEFVSESIKDLPVKVLGKVENSYELLKMADIFLHISLIDTFSLITLEAMSIGLPLVATNRGALKELIEDNETGLLVNFDSDEIAAALLELVNDIEKAKKLGEKAKIATKKYNENRLGKVWEDFLMAKIRKV